MIKILSIFFSLFILIFYYIFLFDSVHSYFSQDDFFHLRQVLGKNISDIPSFFVKSSEGQTFYRPISREVFNLIMYKTFNLNPLPFHIVNLALILFNVLLIQVLLKKITNSNILSLMTAIIYSLSAIHSIELYYLASVQTLIAASLVLFAIIAYIKYLKNKELEVYLATALLYLLALLSHESVIILPGILFMVEIFIPGSKFSFKDTFKRLLLFSILGLVYLVSTAIPLNLPKQQVYQPVINLRSAINTLGWYSLWSFNFPEMLVDFMGPNFSLNPNFIKWYGSYAVIILCLSSFIIFSFLFLILKFRKNIFRNKLLYLFISCYLISLSPYLFFPQHKFVYYLSLPAIWILAILAFVLSIAWQGNIRLKILALFTIFAFGLFSYQTIKLNQNTHWASKRAAAAKVILQDFKQAYPNVETNTIFYIIDDLSYPDIAKEWGTSSRQAFYILSGSDALKLLYSDPSIETYYQATGGLPISIDKKRVINFVAKVPY